MAKFYPPAAQAALDDGTAIVAGAVLIDTVPAPFCVWGGYGRISLNLDGVNRTYEPLGDRALISVMAGGLGTADQGAELLLNGIDPQALALIDTGPVRARPCILAELVWDGAGTTLLSVNVVQRGLVDRVIRDEAASTQGSGGLAVLKAIVLGAARGLRRGRVRLRSDADQRLLVGTDGAFKRVGFAAEIQLNLGGQKPQGAGAAAGGQSGGGFVNGLFDQLHATAIY